MTSAFSVYLSCLDYEEDDYNTTTTSIIITHSVGPNKPTTGGKECCN